MLETIQVSLMNSSNFNALTWKNKATWIEQMEQ